MPRAAAAAASGAQRAAPFGARAPITLRRMAAPIWIVMPTYNEAANLEAVVARHRGRARQASG